MRKPLIKIIQLLDGTPAVYGKRQSGQSVVELALITPILIVLLAGLVEIGWFANNYLTLLDVTRAGARRGAALQDQRSPLFWDNKYSYVPNVLLPPVYRMPNNDANGSDSERFFYRWYPPDLRATVPESWGDTCLDYDETTGIQFDRKFYNEVICTMVISMDPLVLNPENGIDDMIVSGYALQMIDASAHPSWLPTYDSSIAQMVVVGRYPTNANECQVQLDALGNPSAILDAKEGRDPFDIDRSGGQTTSPFVEISGYDAASADPSAAEKQVGFALFGNHRIPGYACTGSEWTMSRMENLMNLPNFDLTDNAQRAALPSQGVILTEIYWEHEMLLKIPVLSPVFTVVGNDDGKMVISVWAAFPLSSVEPHIIFP